MRKEREELKVIYTIKDGSPITVDSVKIAAEETGCTEASIRAACSRSKLHKSDIKFEYANKRSHLGRKNKKKGNNFELQIVKQLNELGFNVVTSRSESRRKDDDKIDIADLDGNLPTNIQTKYTANTPSYFDIANSCSDKSKPFSIIWKKSSTTSNSPGTIAMIPLNFFLELLGNSINKQ